MPILHYPNSNTPPEPPTWQPDTPTQSETEQSICRGISALEQEYNMITAQHYRVVGICSDLLANFPPSIGTEILEEQVEISASFASLLIELEALLQRVRAANNPSKKL